MDRDRGVTLLELLVAMAIAALLLAAGVPAWPQYTLDVRLRTLGHTLASDLNHARRAAVTRNRRVTVCPGAPDTGCGALPHWETGWFLFQDDNGDQVRQASEELLSVFDGTARATVRSSAARSRLTFFPNGTAPGSNATFWLCDRRGADRARQVRVSLIGRVRSLAPDDVEGDGCAP